MTFKSLHSNRIEPENKGSNGIIIPGNANAYSINPLEMEIEFYYVPNLNGKFLGRFWKIAQNAYKMDFYLIDNGIGGNIVCPRFYDRKGIVLRIGNREVLEKYLRV